MVTERQNALIKNLADELGIQFSEMLRRLLDNALAAIIKTALETQAIIDARNSNSPVRGEDPH